MRSRGLGSAPQPSLYSFIRSAVHRAEPNHRKEVFLTGPTSAGPAAGRHPRLQRLPLVLALCQVQFPAVLRIAEKEFAAIFQEQIRHKYPIFGEEQQMQFVLGPQGVQAMPAATQLRFSDPEGAWAVVLSTTSLTIENRNYLSIDDFASRLQDILAALAAQLRPAFVDRVGLRYINEIRLPEAPTAYGWNGLISEWLLGPLSSHFAEDVGVEQAVQEIRLTRGDSRRTTLRHGHIAAGTTVPPPPDQQPPHGPFYLLDLDHSVTGRSTFSEAKIIEHVMEANAFNWSLFRRSLTDKLFNLFEPRDVG